MKSVVYLYLFLRKPLFVIIIYMIKRLIIQSIVKNRSYPTNVRPFLYKNLSYSFSKTLQHPIIDKIINGQDQSNIQSFLPQISALGEQNRQLALKLILKKIYINKYPISLLSNPKMLHHLNKHPEITLEANLFFIKEQMKNIQNAINKADVAQSKEIMGKVNDNFLVCFESIKKIGVEKKLKHEIMLHKRFADYYLLYFSKLVDRSQRKDILQKSRDFFKSSLNMMPKLIQEEKQKLQGMQNYQLQPGQKKEEHEFRMNAMRQNIRMLIQTNSENVLHIFMAQNQLQQKGKDAIHLQQNIIGLMSYFERAISYYQMYRNLKAYSIFYHRLSKIAAELNYYAKISAYRKYQGNHQFKEFQAKMWEELSQALEKLYNQTKDDIQQILKSPKNIGSVQELSLLLLSIKIHKMNKQQMNFQDFKAKLLIQVQNILLLLENADIKKIISSSLAKVVKQTIDLRLKHEEAKPSKD